VSVHFKVSDRSVKMTVVRLMQYAATNFWPGPSSRRISSSAVLSLKEIRHVETKDKILVEVI
jgi:hypothetical protein